MWWPGMIPHDYLRGERSWKLLEINDGIRFVQNRTDNSKQTVNSKQKQTFLTLVFPG